ncbi:patatin-like phospholipase family protein [Knoellia koreensis]|jgi:NTE family protein|uniref:Patatin n=1 Tax=Knoellia koreensis TaxID=2730921 RepID=A0A849HII3_9MICO|nr:patatin-like phospholipase family protein [Knoellia sp. DB2414S]NNM47755.1 patatin [Knoellia sp. DB2414S]
MTSSPRFGLALGGGAALGAAHIGVLHALADHDIRPEIITGTSAGALVGAAFAAGLPLDLIEEKIRTATWATFGQFTVAPRLALLDSSVLSSSVALLGHEPRIEDLPRRFAAVATDLRTRASVVLSHGPLDLALRASIAVPGLFPPVAWEGRLLVDGGLTDNLPIRPARDLGADVVIAVRLYGGPKRAATRRPAAAPEVAPPPDVETLIIEPQLGQLSKWSRSDVPRIIDEGRRAADAALAAIQMG